MASRHLLFLAVALCVSTAFAVEKRPLTANSISDGTRWTREFL